MEGLITAGNVLILVSLVPLGFLIYTLLNLETLGISVSHPRVMVEFSIFLILLLAGIYLKMKQDFLLL
jgi:hypothetical protein